MSEQLPAKFNPPQMFNLGTATSAVLNLKKEVGSDLIALGKWLNYVKDGIPRNEWMSWLRNEVHIPYVQAYRYMKISEEVDAGTVDRIGYSKVSEILELPASKFRTELLNLATGLTKNDIREIKKEALSYQEQEENKLATNIISKAESQDNVCDEALNMLVGSLDAFHNLNLSKIQPYYIDLMESQLSNAQKKIGGLLKTLEYVKA